MEVRYDFRVNQKKSSVRLYSYLFYMALMVYLCYLYLFTYISVLLLYGVDGLFMLFVFIYLY